MITLDARVGPQTRYISGAFAADLDTDLSALGDANRHGRHPLPSLDDWCRTVGAWGITPDTDVLVVDDQDGGMAAARCWWMLRAIGHTRVRVEGIDPFDAAWVDAPPQPPGGPAYPATHWYLPTATDDDVERARTDPTCRVVDARSAERFRGDSEPIDPVAGHIPGAVNLPWQAHTDIQRFESAADDLLSGIHPENIIIHCGSGVTACHTLLQLDRLGRALPALYVGSWSAWCRQGRPVATSS